MAKNLIIIFFIVSLLSALIVFIFRDKRSLRENLAKDDANISRLVLKGFVSMNFESSKLISSMRGDHAYFLAPNRVEIIGNILAQQNHGTEQRKITCDRAVASFESSELLEMLAKGKLIDIAFKDNVYIETGSRILKTEFARFLLKKNLIISDRFVTFQDHQNWFTGTQGFYLDLNKNDFEVFGKINGMMSREIQ